MDPRPRAPRRPALLSSGLFLLGLSFLVTALGTGTAPPAVAWAGSAAFWAGMICVAGHVLRLALAPAPGPSSSSESRSGASSESWGETERWGPPSQR